MKCKIARLLFFTWLIGAGLSSTYGQAPMLSGYKRTTSRVNLKYSKSPVKEISENGHDTLKYIAISYDFSDSISVFVNDKFIQSFPLVWVQPDSSTTIYPFNRRLIKLDHLDFRRKRICVLFFHRSNQHMVFAIKRRYQYYGITIQSRANEWELMKLNTLPWPD